MSCLEWHAYLITVLHNIFGHRDRLIPCAGVSLQPTTILRSAAAHADMHSLIHA